MLIRHELEVMLGELTNKLLDYLHLVQVVFTREYWGSSDKLGKDTADGPHVNLLIIILLAEHDFGRTVPPSHDVLREGVSELCITVS
jgi:hypothetical protein